MSIEYYVQKDKKDFWDIFYDAIKEILEYPENNSPITLTFDEYVQDEIIPYLMIKGKFTNCSVVKTVIMCSPCPYHRNDSNDRYIINPLRKYVAGCLNQEVLESEFLTLNQIKTLEKLARKGKIILRRFK
jgi:hypothetical protein